MYFSWLLFFRIIVLRVWRVQVLNMQHRPVLNETIVEVMVRILSHFSLNFRHSHHKHFSHSFIPFIWIIILLYLFSYHIIFFRGDVFTRSGSFGRQRSDSTGLKQFVSLYNIYPCYYSTVFKTILEISVINYQQISTTENLTWAQNRKLKPFDRFLQWWIYWFKIIYFLI